MQRRLETIGPSRFDGRRRLRPVLLMSCAVALMFPTQTAIATDTTGSTATTVQSGPGDAEAAIPAFDLVDLRSGRPVDLARLRTPGRAMLVWLWAPG